MTWQAVGDVAKRVFNEDTPGCPYCGAVMVHQTEEGHAFWYPGVECCADAIRRQVSWRANEINQVQARITERRQRVQETIDAVEEASYQAKGSAQARADRASKALAVRMREEFEPALKELSSEIARLKRKLMANHP